MPPSTSSTMKRIHGLLGMSCCHSVLGIFDPIAVGGPNDWWPWWLDSEAIQQSIVKVRTYSMRPITITTPIWFHILLLGSAAAELIGLLVHCVADSDTWGQWSLGQAMLRSVYSISLICWFIDSDSSFQWFMYNWSIGSLIRNPWFIASGFNDSLKHCSSNPLGLTHWYNGTMDARTMKQWNNGSVHPIYALPNQHMNEPISQI